MISVFLNGVGLAAPGLRGWEEAREVLRGNLERQPGNLPQYQSDLIPQRERRRASGTAKLAVHVAEQAVENAGADPAKLAAVFASFAGDLPIADRLCSSLTMPGRPVSPYQFHNSVHNAPAAYWSIATGSRNPSTSIACAATSFSAALLEAVSILDIENLDVLLTVYDVATPKALAKFQPTQIDFGVALVLQREKSGKSLAELKVKFKPHPPREGENSVSADILSLINANVSAQSLILLSAVAAEEERIVSLKYLSSSSVEVETAPCL